MNKFWIILAHTYMTRVKTKAFLISTIITLLFIIGIANVQTIMDAFSDDSRDQIAVIDESGELVEPLSQTVEQSDENMELVSFDGSEEEAKTAVQEEEYQALIVLALNSSTGHTASRYRRGNVGGDICTRDV